MTKQKEVGGKTLNKKFKKLTVPELRLMADSLGVDHKGLLKVELREAIRKADDEVIYPPEKWDGGRNKIVEPGVESDDSGIIMSSQKPAPRKIVSEEESNEDKVAVYSERNVSAKGMGKIEKGFNFISKDRADEWVKRRGIREATAVEVAQYYGVS